MKGLWKRLLIVAALAALAFALAGCIELTQHVTINSDNSADIEMTVAVDKSALESFNSLGGTSTTDAEDPFAKTKTEAEGEGYTVEDYESEDGAKTGFVAKKHLANASDLASEMGTSATGPGITVDSDFFKSSYTVDLTMVGEGESADAGDYSSVMTSRFLLTFPEGSTIGETNGTPLADDPMTLEWEMSPGSDTVINAVGTWNNPLGPTLLISCGCCAVLLIVLVVVIVLIV
ncbi:MAG: hypothetical protein FDZ70_00435, partial [Actinobacteria bacterium]